MKTIVHVARNAIAANLKHGTNEPAIIVRNYKGSSRHYEVQLAEGVRIVHRQNEPLPCGARVWIEKDGEVEVIS